jgi:hypothetical protein
LPTLAAEQRRRAQTCTEQATKAPTDEHKAYWLKMAHDWLDLAKSLDEANVSPPEGADQNTSAMRGQCVHQLCEALMRDERQLARGERHQAVVHDVDVEALQVRDVARH